MPYNTGVGQAGTGPSARKPMAVPKQLPAGKSGLAGIWNLGKNLGSGMQATPSAMASAGTAAGTGMGNLGAMFNNLGGLFAPQKGGGFDWTSLLPLIGGATDFLNINQAQGAQDDANRANEDRYRAAFGDIENFQDLTNKRMNVEGQRYKDQIGTIMGHMQEADEAIQSQGQEARRRVTDTGKQREAGDIASAQRRNMGNTSVVEGLKRQSRDVTDRNLADVDESVAGLRSGMKQQMAQVQRMIENDLNDFIERRTGFQYGLVQDKNRLRESRTDQANMMQLLPLFAAMQGGGQGGGGGQQQQQAGVGGFGDILGPIGSLVGTIFGGPGGGAMGGGLGNTVGSIFKSIF